MVRYGSDREIKIEISVGDFVVISKCDLFKSDFVGIVVEKGKCFFIVVIEIVLEWVFKGVRIDFYVNDIIFKCWMENFDNLRESGRKVFELYFGFREFEESEFVEF